MTGVAGHNHLFSRKISIDLLGHRNHVAGDFLFWILVAREITLDMAVDALHAKTGGERPHDLANFGAVGYFQNLQIGGIGGRPLGFVLLVWSFVLSEDGQKSGDENRYEAHRLDYIANAGNLESRRGDIADHRIPALTGRGYNPLV
jgi:hypothetical protein